jgi:hypothetical protein
MEIAKKLSLVLSILLVSLFVLSCAEMAPPTPYSIIKHPLGTTPLEKGMEKEQVVILWGSPNEVNKLPEKKWVENREEWVYYARYPAIPLDYNYLSETQYLYFEGDTLINWKSESQKQQ